MLCFLHGAAFHVVDWFSGGSECRYGQCELDERLDVFPLEEDG